MDTANRAVQERRAFWQEHLTHWQASGLTQVAYCRQQGLNRDQFGYWKKRLLSTRSAGPAPGGADFIAVQWASAGAPLVIVLNARLRVEVQPGFDPVTRRAVVQALGGDGQWQRFEQNPHTSHEPTKRPSDWRLLNLSEATHLSD